MKSYQKLYGFCIVGLNLTPSSKDEWSLGTKLVNGQKCAKLPKTNQTQSLVTKTTYFTLYEMILAPKSSKKPVYEEQE